MSPGGPPVPPDSPPWPPARISAHITWGEATKSQVAERRGLLNEPSAQIVERMRRVANTCYEPARLRFGPLAVSSFYRSPAVNKVAGGSPKSQHMTGEAIDIDGDPFSVSNRELFAWLRENVPFDQLIWEFGDREKPAWVHVSYRLEDNRREVIRAVRRTHRTAYLPFDLE